VLFAGFELELHVPEDPFCEVLCRSCVRRQFAGSPEFIELICAQGGNERTGQCCHGSRLPQLQRFLSQVTDLFSGLYLHWVPANRCLPGRDQG